MLNTAVYWPEVESWSFSVITFSQVYLVDHPWNPRPSLRHVPMVGWQIFLWLSVHLYLKKPPTSNFHRLHRPNQLLLNNYLYLGCRCRNSCNLVGHSVPLTGFQNSTRRASTHLSYLLGLLEVEQSLASLCFIFDSQNPHIILGNINNGTSFFQARLCFGSFYPAYLNDLWHCLRTRKRLGFLWVQNWVIYLPCLVTPQSVSRF